MKKLLLAGIATALLSTAANAADLPARVDPVPFVPVAPLFTWTGAYFGTHTSYNFTDNQRVTTVGNAPNTAANVAALRRAPSLKIDQEGFGNIGGGFGYNYQFTPGSGIVVGVGFDIDWTDIQKNRGYAGPALAANGFTPDPSVYSQSLNYLGTVNGKIGYAFDRFLVYGTGGLAFGDVEYAANFFTPGLALQFTGATGRNFETGYNYGGGIEWAIPTESFLNRFSVLGWLGVKSEAVTVKAEYIRYDLGSRNVLVNAVPGVGVNSYTSRFQTEGSLVRAGINYKFAGF